MTSDNFYYQRILPHFILFSGITLPLLHEACLACVGFPFLFFLFTETSLLKHSLGSHFLLTSFVARDCDARSSRKKFVLFSQGVTFSALPNLCKYRPGSTSWGGLDVKQRMVLRTIAINIYFLLNVGLLTCPNKPCVLNVCWCLFAQRVFCAQWFGLSNSWLPTILTAISSCFCALVVYFVFVLNFCLLTLLCNLLLQWLSPPGHCGSLLFAPCNVSGSRLLRYVYHPPWSVSPSTHLPFHFKMFIATPQCGVSHFVSFILTS